MVSILWTLFFVFPGAYGQREAVNLRLDKAAQQVAKQAPEQADFSITLKFVKQENWDSVLVYSNKALAHRLNKATLDFCHYYRGEAFLKKRLFNQSKQEFKKVSFEFPYYFKVQLYKGEMYLEQGKYKLALDCFNAVDTADPRLAGNYKTEAVQHNIGLCYFHLGDFSKAEESFLKAIKELEARKDYSELIAPYSDLANVYYEQFKDEEAIGYFLKAYRLSKHYGSLDLKQNTAMNMAVVEENRGNFKKALEYRYEYEAWRDSLNDQGKIYEVAQLEKKHAVDQKQKKVKLLETENKLKQAELNSYLFASVLLAVIIVCVIYFYRLNVKRSRIILKQKQELDVLNATKDQLFSIVSHDLRSSVHALRMSNGELKENLKAKSYEKLDDQLEENSAIATNTYNMLDNLLHWALLQTKGGYFHQEEQRLFMLVEQTAYNFRALLNQKEMVFENNLPKSVKAYVDAESLKIVFRNFMDNSIKFSEKGRKIQVALLAETEGTVTIEWRDEGKGMSNETRLKLLSDSPHLAKKDHEKELGSGLGMRLCFSMLQKNGGNLDIWSEKGEGTKMIVTLQKMKSNGTH